MLNSEHIKYLEVAKKIILLLYVVIETLYKTILGKYGLVFMDRLQCVLGVVLIIWITGSFIILTKSEKKKWLYDNRFTWIYLFIRGITFVNTGFMYTMLRSMVFEVVYLVAITDLLINSMFCKKVIMRFFVLANLVLNVINTIIYLYCENIKASGLTVTNELYEFFSKYTFMDDTALYCNYSMYSNPNQMALMTGIALLISLAYWDSKKPKAFKASYIIYFIFSLYCISYSNCSSADVALICVVIAIIIEKLTCLNKKHLILICLSGAILATTGIYSFAAYNDEFSTTDFENDLNMYSTQRYTIWKDSYYCHKDELLFGCGNITLEKRDRYQYKLDKGETLNRDINGSLIDFVGPHNGYIGMISCTGLIGFLAFALAFIKKISVSKLLNDSCWYLVIIFILVINLFECMMPISKNFCSLYMFLILAMGDDNEDKVLSLETEELI